MSESLKPWAAKAHRLISKLCDQSYSQANPKPKVPGTRRRHRPYHVPEMAEDLIKCLNTDDEIGAKRIFLSYDGIKLCSAGE